MGAMMELHFYGNDFVYMCAYSAQIWLCYCQGYLNKWKASLWPNHNMMNAPPVPLHLSHTQTRVAVRTLLSRNDQKNKNITCQIAPSCMLLFNSDRLKQYSKAKASEFTYLNIFLHFSAFLFRIAQWAASIFTNKSHQPSLTPVPLWYFPSDISVVNNMCSSF